MYNRPRYRMWFIGLAVLVSGLALRTASADTWRLDADQKWKEVSAERRGRFLVALANADRFVNTGQVEQAQASFDAIKNDFPEIAGPDIDLFIEAEMHYCKGKLAKTIRSHDKLLSEYPRSSFRDAALRRQFAIGTSFLAGKTKKVLGLIKMKRYGEGIAIMEKITDRTGFDTVMGIDAATAVARGVPQVVGDIPALAEGTGWQGCYHGDGSDQVGRIQQPP
jgi:hypothetical protein